jgi:hypothetical protein
MDNGTFLLFRRRGIAASIIAMLVMLIGATTAAYSQNAIGNVAGVTPAAVADLAGQQITIIQGADLFEGQTITTNADGVVQIVFVDDTRMVIGPNSSLVIERYLLRDPTTVGAFVANALGGTFRFITGDSPKDAYQIRTPAGTITVRGTALDLTVHERLREIFMLLYHGGVTHCLEVPPGAPPACTDLEEACEGVAILGDGDGWMMNRMPGFMFDRSTFLYETTQFRLLRPFQVIGATDCLHEPEEEVEEEPVDESPPCDGYLGLRQSNPCYPGPG